MSLDAFLCYFPVYSYMTYFKICDNHCSVDCIHVQGHTKLAQTKQCMRNCTIFLNYDFTSYQRWSYQPTNSFKPLISYSLLICNHTLLCNWIKPCTRSNGILNVPYCTHVIREPTSKTLPFVIHITRLLFLN